MFVPQHIPYQTETYTNNIPTIKTYSSHQTRIFIDKLFPPDCIVCVSEEKWCCCKYNTKK